MQGRPTARQAGARSTLVSSAGPAVCHRVRLPSATRKALLWTPGREVSEGLVSRRFLSSTLLSHDMRAPDNVHKRLGAKFDSLASKAQAGTRRWLAAA